MPVCLPEADVENCATAGDVHEDGAIAEILHDKETEDLPSETLDSAHYKDFVPSVPALVDSSDNLIGVDEKDSNLKDGGPYLNFAS